MAKMHQTTVRFGSDLWAELEGEAAAAGVSIAQYIRDAVLGRLATSRGARGDQAFGRASPEEEVVLGEGSRRTLLPILADAAGTRSAGELESSAALWAQAEQIRARARSLRERTLMQRTATRVVKDREGRLPTRPR
jgi:hypothetical protein